MPITVVTVFIIVYIGMILGGFPGLKVDRAGIALLGAIAILAFGVMSPKAAWPISLWWTRQRVKGSGYPSRNMRGSGCR